MKRYIVRARSRAVVPCSRSHNSECGSEAKQMSGWRHVLSTKKSVDWSQSDTPLRALHTCHNNTKLYCNIEFKTSLHCCLLLMSVGQHTFLNLKTRDEQHFKLKCELRHWAEHTE